MLACPASAGGTSWTANLPQRSFASFKSLPDDRIELVAQR
jgi:hypothetical protein